MKPLASTPARILALLAPFAPGALAQESGGPRAIGTGNDLLPDPPAAVNRVALELVTIAPEAVIDIAHAPDGSGRLFLVSPAGTIRILKADGAPPLATPFLSDPAFPATRAMSSVAFHPDHATNGRLYVVTGEAIPNGQTPHYFAPQDETPNAFDNVLYEFQVDGSDPDRVDPATKRELLRVRRPSGSHTMSDLTFGGDGYLYVSLGDGGLTATGTPTGFYANGQDTTNPFGCVLRIDVDTIGPNGRYAIPPDNPFANGANGNVPELFAWGLRNPWRLGTDRLTGAVWTGDNGDNTIEEVIRLELGGNYGWGLKEGSFLWSPITRQATPDPGPDPVLLDPTAEYDHNHSTVAFGSVIGGTVYRGQRMPWLRGKYVCFDYTASTFLIVDAETAQLQLLPLAPDSIPLAQFEDITMGEDEAGELYVGRNNGVVLRLVPARRNLRELQPTQQPSPAGAGSD